MRNPMPFGLVVLISDCGMTCVPAGADMVGAEFVDERSKILCSGAEMWLLLCAFQKIKKAKNPAFQRRIVGFFDY